MIFYHIFPNKEKELLSQKIEKLLVIVETQMLIYRTKIKIYKTSIFYDIFTEESVRSKYNSR